MQKPCWSEHKLFSLLDMLRFHSAQFWWLSFQLTQIEEDLRRRGEPEQRNFAMLKALMSPEESKTPDSLPQATESWCKMMNTILDITEGHCKTIGLGEAALLPIYTMRTELQRLALAGNCEFNFAQGLKSIRTEIEVELSKQHFTHIPAPLANYFEQGELFGPEVYSKFEDARLDIKEAGNCLAASLPTASVFHLMRVAEHGLRALAKKLRVKLTHSGKPQPIEFGEWEKLITEVKNKIAAARKLPAGPKRQAKLEGYSNAADHCEYMKDIWRNNVSHTRKPYKESEAKAVLERVRDFMLFLAGYL